jgi:hypothetical protein
MSSAALAHVLLPGPPPPPLARETTDQEARNNVLPLPIRFLTPSSKGNLWSRHSTTPHATQHSGIERPFTSPRETLQYASQDLRNRETKRQQKQKQKHALTTRGSTPHHTTTQHTHARAQVHTRRLGINERGPSHDYLAAMTEEVQEKQNTVIVRGMKQLYKKKVLQTSEQTSQMTHTQAHASTHRPSNGHIDNEEQKQLALSTRHRHLRAPPHAKRRTTSKRNKKNNRNKPTENRGTMI